MTETRNGIGTGGSPLDPRAVTADPDVRAWRERIRTARDEVVQLQALEDETRGVLRQATRNRKEAQRKLAALIDDEFIPLPLFDGPHSRENAEEGFGPLPQMTDGRSPERLKADGDDFWPDGKPYRKVAEPEQEIAPGGNLAELLDRHPGCLLLLRQGESCVWLYGPHAVSASGHGVPAGFPASELEKYLRTLLDAGCKVAEIEQREGRLCEEVFELVVTPGCVEEAPAPKKTAKRRAKKVEPQPELPVPPEPPPPLPPWRAALLATAIPKGVAAQMAAGGLETVGDLDRMLGWCAGPAGAVAVLVREGRLREPVARAVIELIRDHLTFGGHPVPAWLGEGMTVGQRGLFDRKETGNAG